MEQIEIMIDMKTETKLKKVLSKFKLRSMLKSMKKEGLIENYEVTHWSYDGGNCGIGETIISSTKLTRED